MFGSKVGAESMEIMETHAQSEAKGGQLEPKGYQKGIERITKRVLKVSQRATKIHQQNQCVFKNTFWELRLPRI